MPADWLQVVLVKISNKLIFNDSSLNILYTTDSETNCIANNYLGHICNNSSLLPRSIVAVLPERLASYISNQ